MITLIIGPMFSGKTSELVRLLVRASIAGKKVILLRPEKDTRKFLTHDNKEYSLEEKFVDDINSHIKELKEYDVIGIEEGQFFPHLLGACNLLAGDGKEIIISALNGTSESESFDVIQELIPHVESIIKLNAICTECGSEYGSYSFYRAGNKTDKVKVGDIHEYTALCRNCYNKAMT